MSMCGALAGTAVALTLAGCSSEETTTNNTASTTSTAAAAGEYREMVRFSDGCEASTGQAPAAQEIAEGVTLPEGVSIVTGRLSTDSDYRDEYAVAIDLCGGDIVTADDLPSLATQFARAYKATLAVGDQVLALYVAHYSSYTTTETVGEVKLRDRDFQLHRWNATPSERAGG